MGTVCWVMEEEPSGRTMGMGLREWRESECRFWKEVLMTLPSAPPSMRMRAGCPLIEPMNVSRVRSASVTLKDCSRTTRLRIRLSLLLVSAGVDAFEEAGSRSIFSGNLGTTDGSGQGFATGFAGWG